MMITQFYCPVLVWKKDSHFHYLSVHTQTHTGECADRPGGSSGGEDQRTREFAGGASTQTQLHRGDAAAGTQLCRPQTFECLITGAQSGNSDFYQKTYRVFISVFFHLMRCDRARQSIYLLNMILLQSQSLLISCRI